MIVYITLFLCIKNFHQLKMGNANVHIHNQNTTINHNYQTQGHRDSGTSDDRIGVNSNYWKESVKGTLPHLAVKAGNNFRDYGVYVARFRHEESVLPGKFIHKYGKTFSSYKNAPVETKCFEVLCDKNVTWYTFNFNKKIPPTAIIGGIDMENKIPLYIGRIQHEKNSITVGKVDGKTKKLYVVYQNKEHIYDDYEILVSIAPDNSYCNMQKVLKLCSTPRYLAEEKKPADANTDRKLTKFQNSPSPDPVPRSEARPYNLESSELAPYNTISNYNVEHSSQPFEGTSRNALDRILTSPNPVTMLMKDDGDLGTNNTNRSINIPANNDNEQSLQTKNSTPQEYSNQSFYLNLQGPLYSGSTGFQNTYYKKS